MRNPVLVIMESLVGARGNEWGQARGRVQRATLIRAINDLLFHIESGRAIPFVKAVSDGVFQVSPGSGGGRRNAGISCPKCGHLETIVCNNFSGRGEVQYAVICDRCEHIGPIANSPKGAVKAYRKMYGLVRWEGIRAKVR